MTQKAEVQKELAAALAEALKAIKPFEKVTVATHVPRTPWSPPPGEPRAAMKRPFYHHGIPIEDNVTNEDIHLLNRLKPGVYCDGFVRVIRRRDGGLDIEYPIKTYTERQKLPREYGILTFTDLLRRLIDEATHPEKYRRHDEEFEDAV